MLETEPPPYTADMMKDEARDALGNWLQGYTEPDPETLHPQRRVKEMTVPAGSDQVFKVEGARHTDENDRYFKIEITVTELDFPPEDPGA